MEPQTTLLQPEKKIEEKKTCRICKKSDVKFTIRANHETNICETCSQKVQSQKKQRKLFKSPFIKENDFTKQTIHIQPPPLQTQPPQPTQYMNLQEATKILVNDIPSQTQPQNIKPPIVNIVQPENRKQMESYLSALFKSLDLTEQTEPAISRLTTMSDKELCETYEKYFSLLSYTSGNILEKSIYVGAQQLENQKEEIYRRSNGWLKSRGLLKQIEKNKLPVRVATTQIMSDHNYVQYVSNPWIVLGGIIGLGLLTGEPEPEQKITNTQQNDITKQNENEMKQLDEKKKISEMKIKII